MVGDCLCNYLRNVSLDIYLSTLDRVSSSICLFRFDLSRLLLGGNVLVLNLLGTQLVSLVLGVTPRGIRTLLYIYKLTTFM